MIVSSSIVYVCGEKFFGNNNVEEGSGNKVDPLPFIHEEPHYLPPHSLVGYHEWHQISIPPR
jgi:hypothetical protein